MDSDYLFANSHCTHTTGAASVALSAVDALALGEKPRRLLLWISLGVIQWCLAFAVMAGTGSRVLESMSQ